MTNVTIIRKVYRAIGFFQNEQRPLQPSVHERTIAHRLAVRMEALFRGWDVDCEYNRHEMLIKKLDAFRECDGEETSGRIFPDIIVHKRTNESEIKENLLVIEMKRNNSCGPCDKLKLELLTDSDEEYGYQLGLYINLRPWGFVNTWYRDGLKVRERVLTDSR